MLQQKHEHNLFTHNIQPHYLHAHRFEFDFLPHLSELMKLLHSNRINFAISIGVEYTFLHQKINDAISNLPIYRSRTSIQLIGCNCNEKLVAGGNFN